MNEKGTSHTHTHIYIYRKLHKNEHHFNRVHNIKCHGTLENTLRYNKRTQHTASNNSQPDKLLTETITSTSLYSLSLLIWQCVYIYVCAFGFFFSMSYVIVHGFYVQLYFILVNFFFFFFLRSVKWRIQMRSSVYIRVYSRTICDGYHRVLVDIRICCFWLVVVRLYLFAIHELI